MSQLYSYNKHLAAILVGMTAHLVDVTAERQPSAPSHSIRMEGVEDSAFLEGRLRIRSSVYRVCDATSEGGWKLAISDRLAGWPSHASSLDLACAVAIVGVLTGTDILPGTLFIGELSLTGQLRPVRGVSTMLRTAYEKGVRSVVVPQGNRTEAAWALSSLPGMVASAAHNLANLMCGERGEAIEPMNGLSIPNDGVDLTDIRGMAGAKRAMEVAIAGRHNVLMIGQPGTGKSALARRASSLAPAMTQAEVDEVTAIHSIAGLLPLAPLPRASPHGRRHGDGGRG